MIVGWAVLSPISKSAGWAPGPVSDMTNGARGWILWISLAIMCADSFVALVPVVARYIAKLIWESKPHTRAEIDAHKEENDDREPEPPERLVPMKWVVVGLTSSIVVGIILVWIIFGHEGIKPWASLVGFIISMGLSVLGARALGETDLNPVSGLGKIAQLLFAVMQPGQVVANIIAGGTLAISLNPFCFTHGEFLSGIAEAGAQQYVSIFFLKSILLITYLELEI